MTGTGVLIEFLRNARRQHVGGGDGTDDLEPTKEPKKLKDLSSWNIEDLEAYIAAMETEIARAREMIDKKQGVSSAAEALFKR